MESRDRDINSNTSSINENDSSFDDTDPLYKGDRGRSSAESDLGSEDSSSENDSIENRRDVERGSWSREH